MSRSCIQESPAGCREPARTPRSTSGSRALDCSLDSALGAAILGLFAQSKHCCAARSHLLVAVNPRDSVSRRGLRCHGRASRSYLLDAVNLLGLRVLVWLPCLRSLPAQCREACRRITTSKPQHLSPPLGFLGWLSLLRGSWCRHKTMRRKIRRRSPT